MFLHIGRDIIINNQEIIGIFNIEYIQNTKEYKSLYNALMQQNGIINICGNKTPRTCILLEKNKKVNMYITHIGANTIGKRKM